MVNCETSALVWNTLLVYFNCQIRAKVTQLRSTKKGSLVTNEYLLKIRGFVYLLALVGHNPSSEDHIDASLEFLPLDY